MALRFANKIKCNVIQNLSRAIFTKPEVISAVKEDAASVPQTPVAAEESTLTSTGPYSVCKARAVRFQRSEDTTDAKAINVDLQPSKLQDYFNSDAQAVTDSTPAEDGVNRTELPQVQYRRFEASKTQRSVTLPLKIPKLASPFPDPVKIMSSHTVSDREKADQMFAESRLPKVGMVGSNVSEGVLTLPQTRNYSRKSGKRKTVGVDPKKCRKLGDEDDDGGEGSGSGSGSRSGRKGGRRKKKKCKKMVSPKCKPPKKIDCEKKPKRVECTKISAPYPSYSESCYKEPERRPSECRICPWKPDENPNFKMPKKKYHTSAVLSDLRKPECERPGARKKEPCGWQKKDDKKKNKKKTGKHDKKKKKKTTAPKILTTRKYYFDVRKKPCTSRFYAVKKQQKKANNIGDKTSWSLAVREWGGIVPQQIDADWINVEEPRAIYLAKKKQKGRCVKFPFDGGKKKKKSRRGSDKDNKKGSFKHRMPPCKKQKRKSKVTGCNPGKEKKKKGGKKGGKGKSKKERKGKSKKGRKGKSKRGGGSRRGKKCAAMSEWQTLEIVEELGDRCEITEKDYRYSDMEYRLAGKGKKKSGCKGKKKGSKGKKKSGKKGSGKKGRGKKGDKSKKKKKGGKGKDSCKKKKKPVSRICPGDLLDKKWYKKDEHKPKKQKKDKKKKKKDKKNKKKKCSSGYPVLKIPFVGRPSV